MREHLHMFEQKMLPTYLVNIFHIWCHWVLWFCSCGYLTLNSTMTTTAEFCSSITILLLLIQPQLHGAELRLESCPWPSHSAQPGSTDYCFTASANLSFSSCKLVKFQPSHKELSENEWLCVRHSSPEGRFVSVTVISSKILQMKEALMKRHWTAS